MIKNSVGFGGVNRKPEVTIVQTLLNNYLNNQFVIYFKPLNIDGVCGKSTINAIKTFQCHVVGMSYPDGRIDVGGKTSKHLKQYNNRTHNFTLPLLASVSSHYAYTQKDEKTQKVIRNKSLLKSPNKIVSANSNTDPRQLKTREAVAKVYGAITTDKVWKNKSKYLKAFVIPSDITSHKDYNWVNHYDSKKRKVSKIWCNVSMHSFLQKALQNIKDQNLISELKEYGGCHNIRATRGTTRWSAHSWGLAIDINVSENGLGKEPQLSKALVKCFTDAGFGWGGNYSRKDGMHFTIAGYDLPNHQRL